MEDHTIHEENEEEFYCSSQEGGVRAALHLCRNAKIRPYTMPQLIAGRMNGNITYNRFYTSSSLVVTWSARQLAIFYHIPDHSFMDPENLSPSRSPSRIVEGVGILPIQEVDKLMAKERAQDHAGNTLVHVLEGEQYRQWRDARSGLIKIRDIENTLAHPQIVPFTGSQEYAQQYLKSCRRYYNTKTIGIWHHQDVNPQGVPLARFLRLGANSADGLSCRSTLTDMARFIGKREVSQR